MTEMLTDLHWLHDDRNANWFIFSSTCPCVAQDASRNWHRSKVEYAGRHFIGHSMLLKFMTLAGWEFFSDHGFTRAWFYFA